MDLEFAAIEKKWKSYWHENQVYKVEIDHSKPKYYILDMFPYPSGAGLHVGHPLGYIASDILSRYKRMMGFNVLHPMGFDSFGLPAEQYAIQTGIHPAMSTDDNIGRYKQQLFNLGLDYDWSREVRTSDPSYYKWTQWIFSMLFEHYYDKSSQKALPITLLIEKFNKEGNVNINAVTSENILFTANEWTSMSQVAKNEVLMNYRLAYRKVTYVNWCEQLGTVLANDEVKDGVSERGGFPVIKKPMRQWSLRITAYAERLLDDLDTIEWSDSLKLMQRNWIGRSTGLQMFFQITDSDLNLEIYTTRPDTIFGVTFMVVSPEHPILMDITGTEYKSKVEGYKNYATNRSELERTSEKKVTGEFTGAYAVNPLNNTKIPIYVSEYVLMDYGTGAIMAVPSDDDRDRLFAQKFNLPIVDIIDKSKYPGSTSKDKEGIMINSEFLNGMEVPDAIEKVINAIESANIGKRQINYKLRDANYSRQRYWGEPFPIKYDKDEIAYLIPESDYPVELPELSQFKSGEKGKSPLYSVRDWVELEDGFVRETDTMPGYAGSSWYFLRYMDPRNDKRFVSKDAIEYWKDVDFYIGGTEHAVGHLMYSRFWHKFLYDTGYVKTIEPFRKLVNQGMIQGVIQYLLMKKEEDNNIFVSRDMVKDADLDQYIKIPVHIEYVKDHGAQYPYLDMDGIDKFKDWIPEYANARFETPNLIVEDGKKQDNDYSDFKFYTYHEVGKMSKRYYNVVNPDDVIDTYGADTFRMYEMFLGPIEQSKPWDTKGIDGIGKFLRRFWNSYFNVDGQFYLSDEKPSDEELKILHKTIKKVTEDITNLSYNTAISAMMIFMNEMKNFTAAKREIFVPMIKLLAPFAPFITEELWHLSGGEGSVHHQSFPTYNESFMIDNAIEYPICFNGKKRGSEIFDASLTNQEIEAKVRTMELVEKWREGRQIVKVIIVPKRMVNIVLG